MKLSNGVCMGTSNTNYTYDYIVSTHSIYVHVCTRLPKTTYSTEENHNEIGMTTTQGMIVRSSYIYYNSHCPEEC